MFPKVLHMVDEDDDYSREALSRDCTTKTTTPFWKVMLLLVGWVIVMIVRFRF
jgi:hypothetical protein